MAKFHTLSVCITGLIITSAWAHEHGYGIPGVLGHRGDAVYSHVTRPLRSYQHKRAKDPPSAEGPKDNVDGRCGPGYGACAAGYCCSAEGWCGLGKDYCSAPDCLFNYATGCDTLKVPAGPSTSNVARPKIGRVPYGGAGIYACSTPGTIALTYDDGPFSYTDHVLDLLDRYNAKATFFISGNNIGKGQIDDKSTPWPAVIQRMKNSNHQIASHTWGHQDLSTITHDQRLSQMYYNEMAFNHILGFFPTYMRPPYSSCTQDCSTDMASLGYHVVYFDLDTEDYLHAEANTIQIAKNNFIGNLTTRTASTGDWLVIEHDIHYQTAYNLTEYMLQNLKSKGYKAVTVGECLGDPQENWYRAGPGSSWPPPPTNTPTPTPSKPISTDGFCGSANGMYCQGSQFGDCCSQYNYCGSTVDHCGTNCQRQYGSCN